MRRRRARSPPARGGRRGGTGRPGPGRPDRPRRSSAFLLTYRPSDRGRGRARAVEPDVVEFLEQFFEAGFVWDEVALADLSDRLSALGGSPVAGLAQGFTGLRLRLGAGVIPEPVRREVEAGGYPRPLEVVG